MNGLPQPLRPTKTEFDTHAGDTSNPHAVTAAQAGADPAGSAAAVAADVEALRAPVVRRTPIGLVPYRPDSDDDVDRATALRAAVAAASSGDIIEAVGEFDLADTKITIPAGVTLCGVPGRSRIYTSTGIENLEVVLIGGDDVVLRDVVVENWLAGSNGTALKSAAGADNFRVERCILRGDIDGFVSGASAGYLFVGCEIYSRFDGIIGDFDSNSVFWRCRIIASGPSQNATKWVRAVATAASAGDGDPTFIDCDLAANDDDWATGGLASLIYAVNGDANLRNCRVSTAWSGFGSPTVLDLAGTATIRRDPNTTFDPAKVGGNITLARYAEDSLIAYLKQIDGAGSGLDADLVRGTTPGSAGLALLDDATVETLRRTLQLHHRFALPALDDSEQWIGRTVGSIYEEQSVAFTANVMYGSVVDIWKESDSIDLYLRVLTGHTGSSVKVHIYEVDPLTGTLGDWVGTSNTASSATTNSTISVTAARDDAANWLPGTYAMFPISDGTPTIRGTSGSVMGLSGGTAIPRAMRSYEYTHSGFADPAPTGATVRAGATKGFGSSAITIGVKEPP